MKKLGVNEFLNKVRIGTELIFTPKGHLPDWKKPHIEIGEIRKVEDRIIRLQGSREFLWSEKIGGEIPFDAIDDVSEEKYMFEFLIDGKEYWHIHFSIAEESDKKVVSDIIKKAMAD